jgi:hypothetical protein
MQALMWVTPKKLCKYVNVCVWNWVWGSKELSWVGNMECNSIEASRLCGRKHHLGGLIKWSTLKPYGTFEIKNALLQLSFQEVAKKNECPFFKFENED